MPRPAPQEYLTVDLLDCPTVQIAPHFARTNAFIARGRAAGGVLVHCHGGVSRASALVCAFLMAHHAMSYDDALARLRAVRPCVQPNTGFEAQLRAYGSRLAAGTEEWRPASPLAEEEEKAGAWDVLLARFSDTGPPRLGLAPGLRSARSEQLPRPGGEGDLRGQF